MIQRQRQDAAVNALRMIPTKWAIVIVAVLIGYVLLQPRVNQWFGWNLPSFASLVGDEKPAPKKKVDKPDTNPKATATQSKPKEKVPEAPAKETAPTESKTTATPKSKASPKPSAKKDANPTSKTTESSESTKGDDGDDAGKMHGVLKDLQRNRYESPEGLIYGPGAEEGHRLKHIAKHLEDEPDRPGPHGVFKGDMKAFLLAIDDGYSRAKRGAKGTKKTDQEDSVVYEASFDKPIGFLGGQDGGRKGNPPLKRMKIVVRGSSVITAFPF